MDQRKVASNAAMRGLLLQRAERRVQAGLFSSLSSLIGICEKMNVEQLISGIFVKNPLWDQTDRQHHNRFVLDKLWDSVAEEMNSTSKYLIYYHLIMYIHLIKVFFPKARQI